MMTPAAASASGAGWVARVSSIVRRRRRSGSSGGVAQPTGNARIGAPLVVPPLVGSSPVVRKCSIARVVEGPIPRIDPAAAASVCKNTRASAAPLRSARCRDPVRQRADQRMLDAHRGSPSRCGV